MKVQHLEYALAISELGSVNKAAEKLHLSQPSLSSALSTLESELGYKVFNRTNNGMSITVNGELFLTYARTIVTEANRMKEIGSGERHYKLKVVSGYHPIVDDSFAALCKEFSNERHIDFSILNCSPEEVVRSVIENRCDVGVFLVPSTGSRLLKIAELQNRVKVLSLDNLQTFIHMSRNHPLAGKKAELQKFFDYPFVDYNGNTLVDSMDLISRGVVSPHRIIYVNDRETRCHLVSVSHAFTAGCCLSKRLSNVFNWESILIPDSGFEMVALLPACTARSEEVNKFLMFLKQGLEEIKSMELRTLENQTVI